jgi:hypothetical protein
MNDFRKSLMTLFPVLDRLTKERQGPPKQKKVKAAQRHQGATRPGARHKQGVHFLGRQIFPVTPAQYRHRHMGKTK